MTTEKEIIAFRYGHTMLKFPDPDMAVRFMLHWNEEFMKWDPIEFVNFLDELQIEYLKMKGIVINDS